MVKRPLSIYFKMLSKHYRAKLFNAITFPIKQAIAPSPGYRRASQITAEPAYHYYLSSLRLWTFDKIWTWEGMRIGIDRTERMPLAIARTIYPSTSALPRGGEGVNYKIQQSSWHLRGSKWTTSCWSYRHKVLRGLIRMLQRKLTTDHAKDFTGYLYKLWGFCAWHKSLFRCLMEAGIRPN